MLSGVDDGFRSKFWRGCRLGTRSSCRPTTDGEPEAVAGWAIDWGHDKAGGNCVVLGVLGSCEDKELGS